MLVVDETLKQTTVMRRHLFQEIASVNQEKTRAKSLAALCGIESRETLRGGSG